MKIFEVSLIGCDGRNLSHVLFTTRELAENYADEIRSDFLSAGITISVEEKLVYASL